jgi:hypothetical protein
MFIIDYPPWLVEARCNFFDEDKVDNVTLYALWNFIVLYLQHIVILTNSGKYSKIYTY